MKIQTGHVASTVILLALTVLQSIAQSTYEPYTFTTLAGIGPGSTDGTGSAARFNDPFGVAVDSAGNVYVADSGNNTIRKVTPTGIVTTLAGLAGSDGSTDGTGSAARFNDPFGVAVDNAGNVYVAEQGNGMIRKVTPAGVVTTLAGLSAFDGTADGTGSTARFSDPFGVAVDNAGNVYVTDAFNNTIRRGYPALVITSSGSKLGFSSGHFGFDLSGGPVGQSIVVESSPDLVNWFPIWTNTLAGPLNFSDPQGGGHFGRFYRAYSK